MTGIYVRVRREGRWQNLEFDELTDGELDAFIAAQDPAKGWAWAKVLARWIREHVEPGLPPVQERT
jgi:hypothetical protein